MSCQGGDKSHSCGPSQSCATTMTLLSSFSRSNQHVPHLFVWINSNCKDFGTNFKFVFSSKKFVFFFYHPMYTQSLPFFWETALIWWLKLSVRSLDICLLASAETDNRCCVVMVEEVHHRPKGAKIVPVFCGGETMYYDILQHYTTFYNVFHTIVCYMSLEYVYSTEL